MNLFTLQYLVIFLGEKHNLRDFWKKDKNGRTFFVQTPTKNGGFFGLSCVNSLDKSAVIWYYYTVSIVADYSNKKRATLTNQL